MSNNPTLVRHKPRFQNPTDEYNATVESLAFFPKNALKKAIKAVNKTAQKTVNELTGADKTDGGKTRRHKKNKTHRRKKLNRTIRRK